MSVATRIPSMRTRTVRRAAVTILLGAAASAAHAGESTSAPRVRGADGVEISMARHAAAGDRLLLWLPGEQGVQEAEARTARDLARRGIEVWRPDFYGPRFLPAVPSSLAQVPSLDAVRVIEAAAASGKALYLLSSDRGAVLLLVAAHQWRRTASRPEQLRGAVLVSPNLYQATPEPGREPDWEPAVLANRLPVFILQPSLSPWHWRLRELEARLAALGAPVHSRTLEGVRDRFYFREDASQTEQELGARLADLIEGSLDTLKANP